jgi:beta-glucosidase
LKNTGKLKGKETAQVYLRQVAPYVLRPYKELKAFEKIELEPGETKEVKINMPPEAFAYYNININDWHIQGGSYQLLVGASSRDIRLKGYIDMKTDYNFS